MRKTLTMLTLALVASVAMAVPAKRGQWRVITLTDGTQINAELRGDEFCSFMQSKDGRVFELTETDGIYMEVDKESLGDKAAARRKAAVQEIRKKIIMGGEHPAYVGTKKGLCVLVQFRDRKFKAENNAATMKQIVNGVGYKNEQLGHIGSVRDYFLAQSDGQFDMNFDVVGPYTLANNASQYSTDGGHYENARKMVQEALILANYDDVPFSDYDWDGDGKCEPIYFLYAGKGGADTGGEAIKTVWPHKSELEKPVKYDGVQIQLYACGPELDGQSQLMGIGTMCHEYSHCLGLPDMYDTDGACEEYATGEWDIMCRGCYNGNSHVPANFNAYERMYCGWRTPIELKEKTHVEGMKSLASGGDSYIIYNEGNRDEYFLIENRQKEGFDACLPGEGMLIYHVDFKENLWEYNKVNCHSSAGLLGHGHMQLLPADNDYDYAYYGMKSTAATDAFPFGNHNSFTDNTEPSSHLYNDNADGTRNLGRPITNITRHEDGTISFDMGIGNDDSDGINEVRASHHHSGIFNILGQRQLIPAKGVSIIGGRKVVVR